MELQLQINVKPGANQSASVDHKGDSSDNRADEVQTKSSFKEQLDRQQNRQLEQDKISAKKENTKLNQQDSKAGTDNDVTDAEVDEAAEQPELLSAEVVEVEEQPEEKPLLLSGIDKKLTGISGQQTAIETAGELTSATPEIAALLPETGNELPSGAAVSPMLQSLAATQSNTVAEPALSAPSAVSQTVEETMAAVNTQSMTAMQGANTGAVISASVGNQQNSPDYLSANRSVNNSDKPLLQNSPVTAEMTADEIILQSARNQQVPLSTAITASLANQSDQLTDISRSLSEAAFSQSVSPANTPANTAGMTPINGTPLSHSLSSSITTHLQSPEWSRQMSDQVSVMLKSGFQQAEIKLNPQHLGPMEIKLTMADDKASIQFVTHHAQVRDVIDAAMPRLRDMLEQQGINLADVDVSTQSEQRQAYDEAAQSGTALSNDASGIDGTDTLEAERLVTIDIPQSSGVNIFA